MFRLGFALDDGRDPLALMADWSPWIQTAVDLLDGDGTFRHWPYPGARSDQPEFDLDVYRLIRNRWNELRNEDMRHGADNKLRNSRT